MLNEHEKRIIPSAVTGEQGASHTGRKIVYFLGGIVGVVACAAFLAVRSDPLSIGVTKDSAGSAMGEARKTPPEPVVEGSLNFVRNILIEDILLTLRSGGGAFPELVPSSITASLRSAEFIGDYIAEVDTVQNQYGGQTVFVDGKVVAEFDTEGKGRLELQGEKGRKSIGAELKNVAEMKAIQLGRTVEIVCAVGSQSLKTVVLTSCQSADLKAQEVADAVVKQLKYWLNHGGVPTAEMTMATSIRLAGLYLLGTTLAQDHVCLEKQAGDRCVETVAREQAFSEISSDTRGRAEEWFAWLQLPIPPQVTHLEI